MKRFWKASLKRRRGDEGGSASAPLARGRAEAWDTPSTPPAKFPLTYSRKRGSEAPSASPQRTLLKSDPASSPEGHSKAKAPKPNIGRSCRTPAGIGLAVLGLGMMIYGANRGEAEEMLMKAIYICLECIGIG